MRITPEREICAWHDTRTIHVCRAYGGDIADEAPHHGRCVSAPLGLTRMTWIKPAFL